MKNAFAYKYFSFWDLYVKKMIVSYKLRKKC